MINGIKNIIEIFLYLIDPKKLIKNKNTTKKIKIGTNIFGAIKQPPKTRTVKTNDIAGSK
tara:strand:+ start:691 stop:870 length:180 start_codon:yes stop_codon:yes gene_type:complete